MNTVERPRAAGARLRSWLQGSHPFGRAFVAVLAPVATILTTMLALGVITPFGGGDALASGVARTIEAGTSELAVRVRADEGDRITRFTATGAFDYRARRGRLRYDFSATPGMEGVTNVEAILGENTLFMRFPPDSGISQRRPWVFADLALMDELLADTIGSAGAPEDIPDLGLITGIGVTDPSSILRSLRTSGDVEKLGEGRVFGVETTRYRARLDGTAPGQRATATVWIGGDDLIRRLEIADRTADGRVDTTIDFSRFGVRVDAAPPPPDRVTSLADIVAQLAGS